MSFRNDSSTENCRRWNGRVSDCRFNACFDCLNCSTTLRVKSERLDSVGPVSLCINNGLLNDSIFYCDLIFPLHIGCFGFCACVQAVNNNLLQLGAQPVRDLNPSKFEQPIEPRRQKTTDRNPKCCRKPLQNFSGEGTNTDRSFARYWPCRGNGILRGYWCRGNNADTTRADDDASKVTIVYNNGAGVTLP